MRRACGFAAIFALGIVVYFVGGYWTGPSHGVRTGIKIALPALLLGATLVCRRQPLRGWYPVALGFLAASCGFLASWFAAEPLLRASGFAPASVPGIAMAKLFDALPIVAAALVVPLLGGLKPGDLYLQKGRVTAWVVVGLLTFGGFTALFLLHARAQGIGADRLLAYAPWTLLFVLSNGFMEELHFRGLLLRPTAALLGRTPANVCIALFFALIHAPVRYTPDILAFVAVVFVLALAWGYVIQRTEALWGAALFHAGADLMIVAGIYTTYGAT